MSFQRSRVKLVHLYHGMPLNDNNKKSKWLIHATTWMGLKCIMMTESKPVSEDCILSVSIYRTFSKWQNYREETQRGGVTGVWQREGGMKEIFLVMEQPISWRSGSANPPMWENDTRCTDLTFLVLILCYNYVRWSCWNKLNEGGTRPLCTIFATPSESTVVSK